MLGLIVGGSLLVRIFTIIAWVLSSFVDSSPRAGIGDTRVCFSDEYLCRESLFPSYGRRGT
jgi:hypothetical protein